MGIATISFPLILAIAFFFFFFFSVSFSAPIQTVHFTSNVGTASSPANLKCRVRREIKVDLHLVEGGVYTWQATENTSSYDCISIWGSKFAGFKGYEPSRDGGKQDIFWVVNNSGFYLGYDKDHLKLVAPWQNE